MVSSSNPLIFIYTGTSHDPWQVYGCTQLQKIVSKHFLCSLNFKDLQKIANPKQILIFV